MPQIGWRAADGPSVWRQKEATREAQNRGRGYRGVAGPSKFWSSCGPGLLDVHLYPGLGIQVFAQGAWYPVSGRCFSARRGNPNHQPQRHPPRALVSPRSNRRGSPRRVDRYNRGAPRAAGPCKGAARGVGPAEGTLQARMQQSADAVDSATSSPVRWRFSSCCGGSIPTTKPCLESSGSSSRPVC